MPLRGHIIETAHGAAGSAPGDSPGAMRYPRRIACPNPPPMLAQSLLLASCSIFLALGTAHLLMTFFSRKFSPREAELESQMREVSPRLTRQTTMWNAWVGFNASHSLGVILFGLFYGDLALRQADLLLHDRFLGGLGAVVLGSYLLLAWRYWFSTPLLGVSLASLLYAGGFLAARF